jgi:chloramphenicol-sensitive protein RarD
MLPSRPEPIRENRRAVDQPPAPAAPPKSGLVPAVAAFLAWGLFPIYFHALHGVPSTEILAHRIVWSAVFLSVLVTLAGRWGEWKHALSRWQTARVYLLSTSLVTVNWLLYIWAVSTGQVLEASLGYFINPLVNVLFGVFFLGEKLRPRQAAAFGLAGVGVLVLVARLGVFPWLALALALTFGGYGLVRKMAGIDPLVGLLVETSLVAPLGLGLICFVAFKGTGALGRDPFTTLLLCGAGVVTAMPLIWFARGVRGLKLSTIGLIQYLAPTLQFLSAVVLFHEPFGAAHAAAFGCIWVSLALYSADALHHQATR